MAAIFIETPPFVPDEDPEVAIRRLHSYLYQAAERLNEAASLTDQAVQEQIQYTKTQFEELSSAVSDSEAKAERTAQEKLMSESENLRSLIIANADLIVSVEDRLEQTLNSSYVAKSEFGEYKEEASAAMTETAQGKITEYNASETITGLQRGNQEALEFKREYQNYIKTGLLFRDEYGNRVYGVAVGENLTRVTQIIDGKEEVLLERTGLTAAFTASKLSFYQNDVEVAYLSNNKLYITQAVVTERFTLGDLVAVVDPTGVALTWK